MAVHTAAGPIHALPAVDRSPSAGPGDVTVSSRSCLLQTQPQLDVVAQNIRACFAFVAGLVLLEIADGCRVSFALYSIIWLYCTVSWVGSFTVEKVRIYVIIIILDYIDAGLYG